MIDTGNMEALLDAAISHTMKVMGPGASPDDVAKATIALANAQYGVSLEAPAKSLVPFLPTWAQSIPREVIGTGNKHTYKRITKISVTGKSTAAEGTRGNAASITADEKDVDFGILSSGLFDVTYEAERAAGTFDNALSRATTMALLLGRRNEVAHILGGNTAAFAAVDAAVAVTVADNTSVTGTLTNVAHYVYIKPLTAMAMQKAILAGACVLPAAATHKTFAGIAATVDQTDGYGVESTVASATPTANKGLTITWEPLAGAAGYAVFVGTTTGIANTKCQGVTGQCSVVLTALSTGGSAGVSGDNSVDANDFKGLLALLAASGSGAYLKNLGAGLSASAGNGIPEIDTMLAQCYAQALGVDDGMLVMGSQDRAQITRKLAAGSSTSLARYAIPVGPDNVFAGGAFADKYVHPVTSRMLPIVTDPTLYSGLILWVPKTIPYPMAEVPAPLKMWLSYDWVNFAYAVTNPKREYENRMRGGLACYLPPAFGMLYNVWNS
ncbi:MAG: hypothetical protein PHU75_03835 [Candidatus Nanopelagicales bacterium]|nr:hypothetical protein [Candidatus Nanopelagicales bacterium]